MATLAVIPARGGSKGIPRKNLCLVAGKPLLAHTILAARAARHLTRLVVSTDDEEIAAVAQRYGAEVVRRPAAIAGDTASSEAAVLHVLDHLRADEGYEPELTVLLQCTAPLTRAEDIDGTVVALARADADSALAVTPFYHFLWQLEGAGSTAVGINHDPRVRQRRQDLCPQFLETGAVYVMRTAVFRHAKHRFCGRTVIHVMPSDRCLEIDEPLHLRIAELLLREQERRCPDQALPETVVRPVSDLIAHRLEQRVERKGC